MTDFRSLRVYFAGVVVIALVAILHGPRLLVGVWNNLGFVALQRASQDLPLRGIIRGQSAPLIDAEGLMQTYTWLERSEAVLTSVSSQYGLGMADLARGSYDRAAERFRAIGPQRSTLANLYSGYALHRQGKTQEALLAWRAHPDSAVGLRQQARLLLSRGLVDDAISIFTWITEIEPDSVQAWLDLSEGYANKNDWLQIASIAEVAAALEPDNLDVRLLQAQVAFRAHNDVATALGIMDDILPRLRVIGSFDDEFRLYRGYVFLSYLAMGQGKPAGAINWLQQAMALPAVGDQWAKAGISQIYLGKGEHEQALLWINRAIAEAPGDYSMYSVLGAILMSQGDLERARGAFERSVTLAPDIVGPHNYLASVLAQIGKAAEAESEYRKALSIDPTNQVARDGLMALGVAP
jgi:tetratricopeptide (TPR) repeat protein